MKILVLGSGGREHAIIKKLKQNPTVEVIYALPGNAGIEGDATCVAISATDIAAVRQFALANGIDYAVVTPDDPLAQGAVDTLTAAGIPCFGPNKKAAEIESSKAFAKQFMRRHNIPTADYRIFNCLNDALNYVEQAQLPLVIKADGLALGKGVIIAQNKNEAKQAVKSMMQEGRFGDSGRTIVVEEFMQGVEVSVLTLCDGEHVIPLVSAMDYKRVGEGNVGANTGGMGAIAPNPYYTESIARQCMDNIFLPTIKGLAQEGRAFKGCLYFGLMLTAQGAKVVEYNCRFGDPETQAVLPLLNSDLLTVLQATTKGTLRQTKIEFSNQHCCCVVLASSGYPLSYGKGYPITNSGTTQLFYAGVAKGNNGLVTSGGRVLNAYATAPTLSQAVEGAYSQLAKVTFQDCYCRKDIGSFPPTNTHND